MASASVEAPKAHPSTAVSLPADPATPADEVEKTGDRFRGNAPTGCFSSGIGPFAASTDKGLGMFASNACTTDSLAPEIGSVSTPGLPSIRLASSRPPPVAIKLFVGRLPLTVTEEMLCTLFSQFGPIADLLLIRDRHTNAFKGCAFVRMQSITDADRAIRHLDSAYVLDPALGGLQVKYAVGEAERLGLPGTSGSGAAAGVDQVKLFVGSLPPDIKEDALRDLFERFGRVEEVFLMRDDQPLSGNHLGGGAAKPGKKSRTGCAFVRFAYKEEALFAIGELNGKFVMPGSQRAMEVRFAENRRSSSSAQGAAPASRTASASSCFMSSMDSSRGGSALPGADEYPENVRSTSCFPSRVDMERFSRMDPLDVLSCLDGRHDCFSGTSESLAIAARSAVGDRLGPAGGRAGDPQVSASCDSTKETRGPGPLRSVGDRVLSKYGSIEDLFETLGHLSLNGRRLEGEPEAQHANPDVKKDGDASENAFAVSRGAAGSERQGQEGKPGHDQRADPTHGNTKRRPSSVSNLPRTRDSQPPNTKEEEDMGAGCNSGSGGRTRTPSALEGGDDEVGIASLTAKSRFELAEFCCKENASSTPSPPTGADAANASSAPFSRGSSSSLSKVSSAPLSRFGGCPAGIEGDVFQYGTASRGPRPSACSSNSSLYVDLHERMSRNLVHPGGFLPSAFPEDAFSYGDFRDQVRSCAEETRWSSEMENGDRLFPPEAVSWAGGQLPSLYAKADVGPSSHESLFSRRGGEEGGYDGINRFLNGLRAQPGTLTHRGFGSQEHGPPGANVFIFHIPNEWSEHDLLTHFSVYGPVLSARIASDRLSGRNRGFGFVSFANGQAAAAAVTAMNGFQVNGKRLKVQIKKGEEQYAHNLHLTPCSNGTDSTWHSVSASCSDMPSGVGDSDGNMPVPVSASPQRDHGANKTRHSFSALDWLASAAKPGAMAPALAALEASHGGSGNSAASLFEAAVALRNLSAASQGHQLLGCYSQDNAAAAAMLVASMRQPGTRRNQESFRLAQLMHGEGGDSAGESLLASSLGLYCTPTLGSAIARGGQPEAAQL
ncbi:putative RNA binding protein [Neospora caninum Liverpool]|uniref:Putative RNA binding protein n=1 Tax=Neospora caninum (strain Liverpool) TaxID=572307 RepID=F0VF62_NEOCL|nr:putative RNA binding protein [Neospora caninum Liverpool]CBZ52356.1 putative RNA binding protein [Neospora caninum Liverpool]|eukprot:XP_003882388.1 putative RNA binding protein [Neospora caninum Liverpool]